MTNKLKQHVAAPSESNYFSHQILLGPLSFYCASYDETKRRINHLLNDKARVTTLIGFINPHVFNIACTNADVKLFLKRCQLCCIDGVGVQIAASALRRSWVPRIVAEELFNDILSEAKFAVSAVMVGVEEIELNVAVDAMNNRSTGLTIYDAIDGFGSDDDYRAFFHRNRNTDVLLIGAATPRSEQIALLACEHLTNTVIWHIGAGTIKTWAGTKRRAPRWVSKLGLQWIHRMWFEPHTRKRYLRGALLFARNLAQKTDVPENGVQL